LEKNSKQRRRRFLTVAAIIAVIALGGLLVVNSDRAVADGRNNGERLAPAGGNEGGAQQPSPSFYESALPSLARMTGALLVVIVCIYAGLYLLKRMTMKQYSTSGRQHLLEVLATTCVAPKKTVSLIRVADKAVLVGMTDSQMSFLTELDHNQTAEIVAARTEEKETDRFARLLKSVSHRVRQVSVKKNQTALET
jgi:flagellar biogenesis protein FliO